ncbi:hypothetical protein KV112_14570 [Mycolicibacter sp. MYC123]|uniref:Uncharacterized protein n=1 Tax=[Mycobacterium] zoologicum TaxID=2872311 RepID=A0ABU5YLL2_9MYCO|nr:MULTISPECIES: hypothetical protein [unclassified Mycolicibacter]MEB3050946.1 hypothetical protein [Mycolicibacter sp. MYC123]MEB3063893.1 hypothetical protein [Mycolicibacter sp. MYC101]
MTFYLVIRDFNNATREEGPELARVEPAGVSAALQAVRPGQEAVLSRLQRALDDAPPRVFDIDDPQILKSKQLLLFADDLSVQFSAYDDVTKEEARYAHFDRPEDPIRFSDLS